MPIKIQKKNNILLFSGIPYYRKTNCKLFLKLDDYMDAAQTKTRDFSKYGNHGTIYGAIPSTTEPTGFYFDGSDDYIDCGSDDSLNLTDTIAIEGWINQNAFTYGAIVNKYILREVGYLFRVNTDGKIDAFIERSGVEIACSGTILMTVGTWYHVAFTYDKSLPSENMKLYVGGVKGGTTDDTGGIASSSDVNLKIGYYSSYWINGTIALIRIYKTLNGNQIKNHYENERNIFGV